MPLYKPPPHAKTLARTNNRPMRLAIASRMLGVPQGYFGIECRESLVDDAINLSPSRSRSTCVYVLGAIGLGVVKVGWSGDVWARLRFLSTTLPCESVVLAVRDASSQELESETHRALLPWHHKGEWFKLTRGSRDVLRSMLAIEIDDAVAASIGGADV